MNVFRKVQKKLLATSLTRSYFPPSLSSNCETMEVVKYQLLFFQYFMYYLTSILCVVMVCDILALARWRPVSIEDFAVKDFGKILKKNALAMRRLMLKTDTNCMRVYDRNLESVPLTVDLYASYARITDYSDGWFDEKDLDVCVDVVSRMLYVSDDHVMVHTRDKREGREQHEAVDEEECEVEVKENGLTFTVELRKRIDTGLFLDHMMTRQMVRELAHGATVLNLFSYTGSFSVYAASGGAAKVVSVDMSPTYSTWCVNNLRSNGFFGSQVPCVTSDAYAFVIKALWEGQKYDLIIFDPPSFSNSRRMKKDFDVQRDHLKWFRLLNGLLKKGSLLLFSTNLSGFKMKGDRIQGFELKEITQDVRAPGFARRRISTRSWILEKEYDVDILAADVADGVLAEAQGADEAIEIVAQEEKPVARKRAPRKTKKEKEAEEMAAAAESLSEGSAEAQEEKPAPRKKAARKAKQVEVVEEEISEEEKAEMDISAATDEFLTEELSDDSDEFLAEDEDAVIDEDDDEDEDSDDSFLSLEWGEEPALSPASKAERGFSKDDSDNGRDNARGRKAFEERRDERKNGDRPRYNDERGSRSFDRPRGGDRPFDRSRDDRPRYNSDRPRFNDDRPRGGDRPFDRSRDDRPRFSRDRDDRGGRPFDRSRDDRPRYNSDRPSFSRDRDDRGGRPFDRSRDDRPRYNSDRPSFSRDRDDRGGRPFDRSRDDRPRFNSDRPSFSRDRDDRGGRPFDRPRGGDRPFDRSRDDRPRYNSDRPSFSRDRDDRGGRPFDRSRDDRPRFNSDRPSFSRDRDDRGGRPFDRPRGGDRPFDRSRDDRPRFNSDRPRFNEDRPRTESKKRGPRPYGFEFAESRNRDDEER
ncbi:rRNA (guanine-N(2)-)-methyltransferase [Parasphaerochaeta coccoides DSM 17374]|uniref:rRNA (Guanine-N(2)-)-methyltransferase n=1 Tax=Parasphaerochaeta coccoides (strain ATCC BAA-1237 / DSM 17374 / SPN1) TaxID=760011 RepID=F4GIP3_PARC1|nr:rRNA (guanine-N(2)-)-methyltransferase [Parasphaerochaeta coccoides DSM 17374]